MRQRCGAACGDRLAVVSGTAVAPVLAEKARELDPLEQNIFVLPVENRHFGAMVNVWASSSVQILQQGLKMPQAVDVVLFPSACGGPDIFWMI